MAQLKITWTRSTIGSPEVHRRTIAALGLHRLHHQVIKEDSASVRGMVRQVRHLVTVEPVS